MDEPQHQEAMVETIGIRDQMVVMVVSFWFPLPQKTWDTPIWVWLKMKRPRVTLVLVFGSKVIFWEFHFSELRAIWRVSHVFFVRETKRNTTTHMIVP